MKWLISTLLLPFTAAAITYQLPVGSNPYDASSNIASKMKSVKIKKYRKNHPPHESNIYYPATNGTFGWIDLLGGLYSELPAIFYTDIIEKFVMKGFIVTYTKFKLNEFSESGQVEAWQEQHEFYRAAGPDIITEKSGGSVTFDTSRVNMICHSSACAVMKDFAIDNPSYVSGYYFSDPVFQADSEAIDMPVQLIERQTMLVHSTEQCDRCCQSQNQYAQRTYNSFQGAGVQSYSILTKSGHCSFLDYTMYRLCGISHFCKSKRQSRSEIQQYHSCIQGCPLWKCKLLNFLKNFFSPKIVFLH